MPFSCVFAATIPPIIWGDSNQYRSGFAPLAVYFMNTSWKQAVNNPTDNDSGPMQESAMIDRFLGENDFSQNTRRAFAQDLEKFSRWFTEANREPFRISRVTTGDVSSFSGITCTGNMVRRSAP